MRIECPHATSVLRWPQLREACASACGCRSRRVYRHAVHARARCGDPRTVAAEAETRTRQAVAEARWADAWARHTFAETCPADSRGPHWCRSVDPSPSRRRRGGHGPRSGCGLVSDPWQHPAVCSCDLRSGSHGPGHRGAAHGPCRHGGRARGSGCGSIGGEEDQERRACLPQVSADVILQISSAGGGNDRISLVNPTRPSAY